MGYRLVGGLYYLTAVSYILLHDLTGVQIGGVITLTVADPLFLILFLITSWYIIHGKFQIPLWKNGSNIIYLIYISLPIIATYFGFLLTDVSVSVFSSPIRFIRRCLNARIHGVEAL